MLHTITRSRRRGSTNKVAVYPAPTAGLNTRDDITELQPNEAWRLDNVVCGETGVKLRNGYASFATGLGDACDTLMVHNAPNGTETCFAATTADIFDITAGGAVGAAVVTGLTNGDWDHVNFTTSGGSYLIIANGADSARAFDGTTWTTPTINNVTSSTLVQVNVHMQRIWFVELNSLDVWYLDAGAISGDATKLPLGQVFQDGGYLMATGSWSRDGADGVDDLFVAVSSTGEVCVYSGTDPASASTWELVGVTRISEPIGRRCMRQVGADLGILTKRGFISLSGVLGLAYSNQHRAAITDKIRTDIVTMAATESDARGWQVLEDQSQGLLVVAGTVTDGSVYHQFTMNTTTKGWSRWTGLAGRAWVYFSDDLYFGDDAGTIWKMTGETDNGEAVDGVIGQGFSQFGTSRTKHLRRIRPHMLGPTGYKPRIVIRTDYNVSPIVETADAYSTEGSPWDTSTWDVAAWSDANSVLQYWQRVIGSGFAAAPVILVSSVEPVTYYGCKLAFEIGDNL